MPWNAPVSPISGTVITVAWATTNVVNPINWLRLLLGNADPPGSSYVVVSSSPTATAWGKVTTDVLADQHVTPAKLAPGAAVANIGYTPVNRAGDTMTAQLNVVKQGTPVSSGMYAAAHLQAVAPTGYPSIGWQGASRGAAIYCDQLDGRLKAIGTSIFVGAIPVCDDVTTWDGLRAETAVLADNSQLLGGAAAGNAAGNIALNNGVTCVGLFAQNATTLGGAQAGNDPGEIAINNGFECANLRAALATNSLQLGGANAGNNVGQIPINNNEVCNGLVASNSLRLGGAQAGNANGNIPLSNGVSCAGLNAEFAGTATIAGNANSVGGRTPTTTPGPDRIPIADAQGTLNSWITTAGIPAGVIAGWPGTSIPAGWTRYTAGNGRLLVGDGTTFGATFAVNTDYGASWSHSHGGAALGVSGTAVASGDVNGLAMAGGVNLNTTSHTHAFSGDVTGSTDATAWQIPVRCVVWIQKS